MLKKLYFFLFILSLIFIFVPKQTYAQTCPVLPPDTGIVTLNANIPSSGTYKIWSRIKPSSSDVNANSFWLQVGSACAVKVGDNTTAIPADTWTWVDFENGSTTDKVSMSLSSGSNVIKIVGSEPMVGVDRLLIMTASDTCTPTGLGDNCAVAVSISPSIVFTPSPTTPPNLSPTPLATLTPAPTNTPVPNSTRFNVTVLLHGIGNGGDNANPTSKGNFTPLHPQRTLTLELYDANNTLVKSITGQISFSSSSGNFTGVLDGGNTIQSGSYLVKVKGVPYLRKQVGGIISVASGAANTLPQAALTTGDANNDNQLNILDYNLLLDCYSELAPARDCTPAKLLTTDFNDDGSVNQFDYNLFLRELSIQTGQ